MKVNEIGEFGLVEPSAAAVEKGSGDVVVGIGGDAAVLRASGDGLILATVDGQGESVRLPREAIRPHQFGRKTLAIKVSDIAATGGGPTFASLSLVRPPDLDVPWVEGVYRGLREETDAPGVRVVGATSAGRRMASSSTWGCRGRWRLRNSWPGPTTDRTTRC